MNKNAESDISPISLTSTQSIAVNSEKKTHCCYCRAGFRKNKSINGTYYSSDKRTCCFRKANSCTFLFIKSGKGNEEQAC